ncbi:unnamed protein product [Eretmochelys imbricata]
MYHILVSPRVAQPASCTLGLLQGRVWARFPQVGQATGRELGDPAAKSHWRQPAVSFQVEFGGFCNISKGWMKVNLFHSQGLAHGGLCCGIWDTGSAGNMWIHENSRLYSRSSSRKCSLDVPLLGGG